MSKKIDVLLSEYGTLHDVSMLTLDQLIDVQPTIETLLRQVRKRIGRALRARRTERHLSLRDIEKLSRRKVNSANLSRVETGEQWSELIVARTHRVLAGTMTGGDT